MVLLALFGIFLLGLAVLRIIRPRVHIWSFIEADGRRWRRYLGYLDRDNNVVDPSRPRSQQLVGSVVASGDRALVRFAQYGGTAPSMLDAGCVTQSGQVLETHPGTGQQHPVGVVSNVGRRSVLELFLLCRADVPADGAPIAGTVVESLCIGGRSVPPPTRLARAAAVVLLAHRIPRPGAHEMEAASRSPRELLLPAALVFTFMFVLGGYLDLVEIDYVVFPVLGPQYSYVVAMLALFGLIVGALAAVRSFAEAQSIRLSEFVHLMNRETGIAGWSWCGAAVAAAGLLYAWAVDAFQYFPLFAVHALTFLSLVRDAPSWPWLIEPRSRRPGLRPEVGPRSPSGTVSVRTYSWGLESPLRTIAFETRTVFGSDEVERLRQVNPFRQASGAITDLRTVCHTLVLDGEQAPQVLDIASYIVERSAAEMLTPLEEVQVTLDFVQAPNIAYVLDEACEEIGYPPEYFRYPAETLFDKRGDCDCKSVLAAALVRRLGFPVILLMSGSEEHAALAIGGLPDLGEAGEALTVELEGRTYVFCETTGDGWQVGQDSDTGRAMMADRSCFIDLTGFTERIS